MFVGCQLSVHSTVMLSIYYGRSSGDVVVKLLACGARSPGFDPGLATTNSSGLAARILEIGDLLLPFCNMVEISLKRRKSLKT